MVEDGLLNDAEYWLLRNGEMVETSDSAEELEELMDQFLQNYDDEVMIVKVVVVASLTTSVRYSPSYKNTRKVPVHTDFYDEGDSAAVNDSATD